jgi:hypothetical protein
MATLVCFGCLLPKPAVGVAPRRTECGCPPCPLCGGTRYACTCSAEAYIVAWLDQTPAQPAAALAVAA